jgi:tRNA (guanosine-2'-O-)-methyltransferase
MDIKRINEHLKGLMTENRYNLFQKNIKDRTNYITVVLEDIFQGHNASAVLRSCDCFGVQNVHTIENRNEFMVNSEIDMGASKWLTVNRYNDEKCTNTLDAINRLKADGYRIVATSPKPGNVKLDEFDITKGKAAIVFGTELTGISSVVEENADEFITIPMYGFTESFNISVSVAIILHHLTMVMRSSNVNWPLTEQEKDNVLFQWYSRSIKGSEKIIEKFTNDK